MNIKIILTIILSSLLIVSCSSDSENIEEEHNDEVQHKNIVMLSIRQMQAINLELGKIEKRNLSTTVKSNGRTKLPPQSKANVSTLIGGAVKNVFVIEGDYVKKGQILATLEHPDIVDMQQQYLENVNSLEFLKQDFLRKKKLFEEKVGSGKDYQKALSDYNKAKSTASGLKAKLQMLGISIGGLERGNIKPSINIVSPINGYVRFVEVNIGSFVEPNSDMFEIVDNRKIHVDILVYEKDIYKIKNGLRVHFTLSNAPGKELKGNIFSVGRAYENEARAITVHANIENAKNNIIPGMYVNAHIMVDTFTTNTLPEDAIVTEGDRYFIFIKTKGEENVDKDNKNQKQEEKWYFKKTEVILGTRDNGFVEIKLLTALPENAEIAINAAYYLLAEMGKGENEE